MNTVDLHVHSTRSDGSYTPTELVNYAIEKGLSAFALTDHDTTAGLSEALAAAEGKDITVIPGIEFSSEYEGRDIHIVGLYIDYTSDFFKRRLEAFVNGRIIRNQEMCKRLGQHGIDITYDQLLSEFPGSVITRAHYATYLFKYGYTKSLKEAFERYIGDHAPCFVSRKKITPMRAIEIILKAGGLPILAHPMLYHMSGARLDHLVSELKEVGLAGIEAIYSTHSPSEEREIRKLAAKYDLLISGGSDFHGNAKPGLDLGTGYGKLFVPEEVQRGLKAFHEERIRPPYTPLYPKIFFTDLDGTLLNSNKEIEPGTRRMLEEWTKAGHKLVLCTGRSMSSVKEVKETLHLDFPGMYLIAYNGGQIYDCDANQEIYRVALSPIQITHVMNEAIKCGLHFHTYTDTHLITPGADEALARYLEVIHTPVIYSTEIAVQMPEGACKCLVIDLTDHAALERFRDAMLPWAGEDVTMLFSNPMFLEIFPSSSGKGNALRTLCGLLHVPIAFSVAAGDAENDLSMIKAAGYSIAMANGTDDIKDAATTITPYDNDHDGLAYILQDLI